MTATGAEFETNKVPPSTKITADEINSDDALVLPLANAVRQSFLPGLQALTDLVEGLKIPATVLGVGAQGELNRKSAQPDRVHEQIRRFVAAVLDRSPSLGVRGDPTGGLPITLEHPLLDRDRVRFFLDPATWISPLTGYDFSFGTRIQGIAGFLADQRLAHVFQPGQSPAEFDTEVADTHYPPAVRTMRGLDLADLYALKERADDRQRLAEALRAEQRARAAAEQRARAEAERRARAETEWKRTRARAPIVRLRRVRKRIRRRLRRWVKVRRARADRADRGSF